MKKVTLSTFAAIFLLASAFADSDKKVVHSINISVPVQMENWKNDTSLFSTDTTKNENNDVTLTDVNFNWNRMTVNDGGFSFLIGAGLGATFLNSDDLSFVDGHSGFDTGLKFGWGFAPVRSENNILALHAFFSFNLKYITSSESKNIGESSVDIESTIEYFSSAIGIDAIFVHNFSEHFGLFAGIDVSTTVLGISEIFIESNNSQLVDNESFSFDISGRVNITPTIGICWII
jgi:hypothetical protein